MRYSNHTVSLSNDDFVRCDVCGRTLEPYPYKPKNKA